MSGVPQMDLGILRSDYFYNNAMFIHAPVDFRENNLRSNKAYYWQDMTLQNAGYTYDYFSPYLLQDEDITCSNQLVQADGVGYQALIVYQEELPYESAQILYQWAKDGLPVVLVDGATEEHVRPYEMKYNQGAALSTPGNDGKDEELTVLMEQMKQLESFTTVQTEAEAYDALINLGVHPRAEYTESNQNLLSVLRKDDGASYLYVYNYMFEQTENYQGQISLEGVYKPYTINTWTGEVEEVTEYSIQQNRTILNIDLAPGDIMVFALDPNSQDAKTVVSTENVDKVVTDHGSTTLYVSDSGKSTVNYSDGTSIEANEIQVPENIVLDKWNLSVEDWQPGEKQYRTEDRGLGYTTTEVSYTTEKVSIDVGETELIPWKDIPQVGDKVSGIGYYTTTFDLPEDWSNQTNGLIFNAESFSGGTATLFVNGQPVPMNMDSRSTDISEYVIPGSNQLEVRVSSSLRNRMIVQGYDIYWNFLGYSHEATPDNYGMVGDVTLNTYTKVTVNDEEQPTPSNPSETPVPSEPSTENPSQTPSQPDGTKPPQTGDAGPILGILGLFGITATAIVISRRKKL